MSDEFIKALKSAGIADIQVAADAATLKGYLGSGNFALNWIMSGKFQGGWPLGHVAEIFGDPSTGKSFIIARAIAEVLKGQGVAVLDDTESAFNPIWASTGLGVDVSRLAYKRSHTLEEHNALVQGYIKAVTQLKITAPSLLALDSLALLTSKAEIEGGMDKVHMKRAQDIKKHFRLIARDLSDLTGAYLVTNHTIANIGDIFNPRTTGGGGGLKFQSTIRLEMRNPRGLKDPQGNFVGVRVTAFVAKNRLVAPWRKADLIIPFHQSISPVSGLVNLLLQLNVLDVSGRMLVYQEKDTKIPEHKSDLWKQEQSAIDLLTAYPTILGDAEKVKAVDQALGEPMTEDSEEP